jgi:hypothetical protein
MRIMSDKQNMRRPKRKKRSSQGLLPGLISTLFVRHRRLWVALLVLVILYVIIRGGMGASTSNSPFRSIGHPSSAYSMPPARVGATIIIDGVACTLVRVEPLANSPAATTAAGQVFVLLHVLLLNVSSKNLAYSADDFRMGGDARRVQDAAGGAAHVPGSGSLLASGTLRAGESAEGNLLYLVAGGDRQEQLVWQPGASGSASSGIWAFDL